MLSQELNLNRKLFSDHLPSILPGVLVGAGSLCPWKYSGQPAAVGPRVVSVQFADVT